MNIVRSWREQKIMLKRRFPILSDNDFLVGDGSMESILKMLEVKLSKTKAELQSLLADLQRY